MMDAFFVGLNFAFVLFELHAQFFQLVHSFFNVIDDEVENSKTCGRMIRLRIDEQMLVTQMYI